MALRDWLHPKVVEAHCDLPCGIYDPEQARIEAESCLKIIDKFNDSKDEIFRQRAILIKEQRAELAKHHIDVLWSDWYKPAKHDAVDRNIKEVFNEAVKQCSKVKASTDKKDAERLLELIDQIEQFWTKNSGPQETRVRRPVAAKV